MHFQKYGNRELQRYYLGSRYEIEYGTLPVKQILYIAGDAYSAPVFASFRANFTNKRIAPFADAKLGYSVGDVEGAYASAGIGVRFALARKMALSLKLEYVYQDYGYTSYGYDSSESLNGAGIKIGFEF